MKQKLLAFFMVGVMLIGSALAQDRRISGTVTSSEDGTTLPGVTVAIEGSSIGTQTDNNGSYTISVPADAKALRFSFLGFTTQTVNINNNTTINVNLVTDAQQLEDVVVTAVGITREAKSLGYAASVLRSDDLTTARETNVLNSLAGKAAGVRVNSTSGTLGGSAKVVIRGVNSLESNSVLYVIDGVPVSNSTSAGGTAASNVDYGNRMGDIGSDDIESMTILKGAAATALYGSRAKDGAIIITTKRGKNAPMSINVNSSVRFENPLVLPEFQNEYAQGNHGVYGLKYTNGWGPKISDVQDQTFEDFLGDNVKLQAYPNNVKDFFQTGVSYMNNISFSGGDEKSDYRLGISAVNESGIIPESTLDKYNFTLNAGRQFSSKLSSRFSGMYTNIGSDGRPAQSSNNTNIITSAIYGLPRVVDINKLRDNFEDPITGEQNFLSTDRTGNNPYWIINYNKSSNKVDRFVGSYNLTYKPVDWISISNNIGGDIYSEKRSTVVRKGTAGTNLGKFTNTDLFYKQLNNDLLVTLDQSVNDDLSFKLIVGNNINEITTESTNVDASGLTIDQLWNYTNAASKTPTLAYTKRRIIGVFGDLGVSYKNMLYANVTGRNDWTSTLPVAHRSYFYPSVSTGFVFSELLKDKNMDWLSFGKIRGSWASVGSDLTPYQLDYQYSPVSTVFLQFVGAQTNIFPIGSISTAFTGPRILPNADLKPQRQKSFEIGTDLRFFDNRIGVDFTYYNTVTRDQLIPIDVAISTGYFAKYVNVGAIRNKGIELMLTGTPVRTNDFSWDINVNFGKNNQVVEELAEGLTQYSLASGWSGLQIKAEVGEPFSLYGSAWEVDPVSGKYVIDPANGLKKVVNDQKLGSIYPDWTMGINNQFNYKGFSLSALLDIRQGGVFYSGTVSNLRTSGLAIETGGDRAPIIDDGVVLQGDAYVPNTTPVDPQDYWANQAKTDYTEGNVFNASFIKLREIRLGYALPKSMLKNSTSIKGVEIGVEARNLWLIKSHVPHVDPELNFFGAGSVGEGVEFNSVPSTRSFGMNLRLTF